MEAGHFWTPAGAYAEACEGQDMAVLGVVDIDNPSFVYVKAAPYREVAPGGLWDERGVEARLFEVERRLLEAGGAEAREVIGWWG